MIGIRTKAATLTAFSQLLQNGISLTLGLVVTPIIVHALDANYYGAWLFLVQLSGYLSLVDFGNSTVLKLDIAATQHVLEVDAKQRKVGAAFLAAILTTPLYLILSIALIFSLPIFMENINLQLRVCLGLLFLGNMVQRSTQIFGHVLFGTNQDYRSITIRTVILSVTGILDIIIVLSGAGLIGLAANKVVAQILLSGALYSAAKKHIPWFSMRVPTKNEFKDQFKRNSIYTSTQIGSVVTEQSDIIIISSIIGPASAAIYSLTGSLIRYISVIAKSLLQSVYPGLGDLFGRGRLEEMRRLHSQMLVFAIALFAVCGSLVILFNESFVRLWVGKQYYAGAMITMGLLLSRFLLTVNNFEAGLLMSCLKIKETTFVHLISAFVGGGLSFVFAIYFGVIGYIGGFIIGRVICSVGYAQLIQRAINKSISKTINEIGRGLLSLILFIGISFSLTNYIYLNTWIDLILSLIIITSVLCCIFWLTGLQVNTRLFLNDLIKNRYSLFRR